MASESDTWVVESYADALGFSSSSLINNLSGYEYSMKSSRTENSN